MRLAEQKRSRAGRVREFFCSNRAHLVRLDAPECGWWNGSMPRDERTSRLNGTHLVRRDALYNLPRGVRNALDRHGAAGRNVDLAVGFAAAIDRRPDQRLDLVLVEHFMLDAG